MPERIVKEANWGYHQFILDSGEVAYRGNMACIDTTTGKVKVGQSSTTLIPIGAFFENLTGDGVKQVNVRLFDEIKAFWWDNDTGSPATAADVGSECYIKDGAAVTMDATGRSKAGRVLLVDAGKGVLVVAGLAVTGPSGAASSPGATVASIALLKAIAAANRSNGKEVLVTADGSHWRFAATSTATDASDQLVVTPTSGSGRWLRADESVVLRLPITFATADAAALFTTPAGFVLSAEGAPYYEVTADFTGGTSSSIGLSSNRTGYTTKGDLIGATLAAALTTGIRPGTPGDKIDTIAELENLFFEAGDTIRHDRIASAFTAGTGYVRVPVTIDTAPASA